MLSVGVSWINAKIPSLTIQITRGEHAALNRIFSSVMTRSTLFTTMASLSIVLAVLTMDRLGVQHLDRLADLPTLTCIAVVTAVNTVIYGMAAYMRAHREEPMLPVSIVGALLTLIAAYFASRHGMFATMLAQSIITVSVALPWTLTLFGVYYRRHAIWVS